MSEVFPGDVEALPLPASVVHRMLEPIPQLADAAWGMIEPLLRHRDSIREQMVESGLILAVGDENVGHSIACVDGATVTANFYLGDVVSSVAVVATGLHAPDVPVPTDSLQWTRFLRHETDTDKLGKAIMAALEVALLADVPHDVAVVDGSHLTFVIAFNSVLSSISPASHNLFVDVATDIGLAEALATICHDTDGARIVASPKSDSSTVFCDLVNDRFGVQIGTNDKLLATLLLEEDEMLLPMRADPATWGQLHIGANGDYAGTAAQTLAMQLDEAIAPLRNVNTKGHGIGITYVRPPGSTTVLKIEFKRANGREYGHRLARSLCFDTAPPHIQEPFAQFMADGWAKAAVSVIGAQQDGMSHAFAAKSEHTQHIVEFLVRRYRTGL